MEIKETEVTILVLLDYVLQYMLKNGVKYVY